MFDRFSGTFMNRYTVSTPRPVAAPASRLYVRRGSGAHTIYHFIPMLVFQERRSLSGHFVRSTAIHIWASVSGRIALDLADRSERVTVLAITGSARLPTGFFCWQRGTRFRHGPRCP